MRRLIGILSALILCAACGNLTSSSAPSAAQPEAGKATITATIISVATGQPLKNTIIRLAPITRNPPENEPIFILDEAFSPGGRTDEAGHITIANVKPGEYVMIVSSDMSVHAVVTESPDKARIWQLEADKAMSLGEIRVKFP